MTVDRRVMSSRFSELIMLGLTNTFILRKSDLAVVQRVNGARQRMTVSAPHGTNEVEVPRFLRTETCLADKQVVEMETLTLTSETTMEHPVDVECAYADGELYL